MIKIPSNRKDIEIYLLSAGQYLADAGAAMGVLPYRLWRDKVRIDEDHCLVMALHCLLVKTKAHNILVDTGIGEYLSDRLIKIYRPGKFTLIEELSLVGLQPNEVDRIVLTHLHFDHAGGLLSTAKELLFPAAEYIVQTDEWATALNPDTLNVAAYSLREHYEALKDSGRVKLTSGESEIDSGVFLEKIAGHSVGMQLVKILDEKQLIYYAGDAFPLNAHLSPAVTSAYDLCRNTLCTVKENIKETLRNTGGKLILCHEMTEPIISFNSEK